MPTSRRESCPSAAGRTGPIARWERDVVEPSFETLRELVRAWRFDLETTLVPYELNTDRNERLKRALLRTPQERLQAMFDHGNT